ncbi:MAG: phage adaptor protein [Planctomycetota bacterium]|jgi:hypothetical protein
MIMAEGVSRILSFLEQTDEVEYDANIALQHLNQAIFEITEDGEFEILKSFASYSWDSDDLDDLAYWTTVPGRVAVEDLTGVGLRQFGYIDRVWLDVGGSQRSTFKQTTLNALLDEYGDTTGEPEKYALDGKYLYLRPVPVAGTPYTLRSRLIELPTVYSEGSEPDIMVQAPYVCIYTACVIGAVWSDDDQKAAKYERLSRRSIDRFAIRNSMIGDSPTEAGEYNG